VFGVRIKDYLILKYGDLSVLSFHSTKTFNTIEGGAIICPDEKA
jgi:dTDP-4-amino-4,6-dideoxygalactose transaminase